MRVEGKGINVRTVLPNLKDVAQSLRLAPVYILKFMGYELGSNVILREKSNDESAQINGALNRNDILNTLDKFIDKFIICDGCKYPEMYLVSDPKKGVVGYCNSCNHVTAIDPKHKLTTYIKKNPPENRTEIQKKDVADASRAERREVTDTGKGEKRDRKAEAKRHAVKKQISESNEELDPYSNKETFDAINEYLNDVMPMNDDYEFDDSHTEVVYKSIKRLRLNKEKYDKVGFILFSYIFNEKDFANPKTKPTSKSILFDQVLERYQMAEFVGHELIVNLSYFFYERNSAKDWARFVPTILKNFNDDEIIENELLIEWADGKLDDFFGKHHLYRKESDDKLKTAAKPFIDWLREEDDEDEEDEEDGEDED